MDTSRHEVGYLAHARKHGFVLRIGQMSGLDRVARLVTVDPYVDSEGEQVSDESGRFTRRAIVVG